MSDDGPPISRCLILSLLLLASSGGGGGGPNIESSASESQPPNDTSIPPADDQPDASSGALPNFVVADLIVSPETSQGETLSMSATVVNTGQVDVGLPRESWLLVSHSADFSTGYVPFPIFLRSQPSSGGSLASGEQDTFTATDSVTGVADLELTQYGTHYARLWVNPNLSAYFLNSGETVEPSYSSIESDYSDNLSPIVAFENPVPDRPVSPNCSPDALEENDTLDTAARIALDTEYTINPCDDWLDIFAVDLNAGQAAELFLPEGPGDSDWYRNVISPSGAYLAKNVWSSNTIFRAETTGTYFVAFRKIPFAVGGESTTTFSVNTLR